MYFDPGSPDRPRGVTEKKMGDGGRCAGSASSEEDEGLLPSGLLPSRTRRPSFIVEMTRRQV
jgi:hypothetical protein